VAYYYRNEGDLLKKEVGAKLIDGRTSAAESDKLMRLWNEQRIPVLGIQPAAGGHGLNLQEGGLDICWYSLTDNQDDYHQLIRRVWRQGVRDTVRVHRLLANKTVDLAMIKGLESKTDFQTAFLAAIEEMQDPETKQKRDNRILLNHALRDALGIAKM
jgi:SNF2 family DNA or RNA helicase